MIWVYGLLLAAFTAFVVVTGRHRKKIFRNMDKKKEALFFLYPAAAKIMEAAGFSRKKNNHLTHILRIIYVKENVDRERYFYYVRKISLALAVFAGFAAIGFLACLTAAGSSYIKELARSEHGKGDVIYELEAEYKGNQEHLALKINALELEKSEILTLFENSFEEVKKEMLGSNESEDNVTEDLNLISEYKGFHIYWETDDFSILDYNGKIQKELEEDDEITLMLSAVFSMEDVEAKYSIPLNIRGKTKGSREKLLKAIYTAIEEKNDPFSREVRLPEEINGYKIRFRIDGESGGYSFLLLAILFSAAIYILYDRKMKEQVEKRREEMMADYAGIISKLNLLHEAGLSIRAAFERIIEDREKIISAGQERRDKENAASGPRDRFAYMEIRLMIEKIRSGVSESEAYGEFGRRSGLYPYIKLGNILEQNLYKGTKGMKLLLKQEVEASFEERKRTARKKGETAGTKMLLPMTMMLLIVIAIVAIPALMSMQM